MFKLLGAGYMPTLDMAFQSAPAVMSSPAVVLEQQVQPVLSTLAPAVLPTVLPAVPSGSSSSQQTQGVGTYEAAPAAAASPAVTSPLMQTQATAAPAQSLDTSASAGSVPSAASMGVEVVSSVGDGSREWMYHLVTFPSYFTPCTHCCGGNRTPKREQLITHFDMDEPGRVYCSHCPEHKTRSLSLLQVRRSAFKDVVKAVDILRFGADVAGVQQYTLNGSKVIYLNREATNEKKSNSASAAPAACSVDGRAMMDKTSLYCSLKCKMQAEDPGFNAWLSRQDPQLVAASVAAANAPPRPTIACKRAASTSNPGSASSSLAPPTGPRAKKAPKLVGNETVTDSFSSGSFPAKSTAQKRSCITKPAFKSGSSTSAFLAAAAGGGGAGSFPALPRIRTQPSGSSSTGSGFLDGPVAVSTDFASGDAWGDNGAGMVLEQAYSANATWGFSGDLPESSSWQPLPKSPVFDASWDDSCFAAAAATKPAEFTGSFDGSCLGEDGSFSPKLITTNLAAHGSGGATFDWWLPGGKPEGEFGSCLMDGGNGCLLVEPSLWGLGGELGDPAAPVAGGASFTMKQGAAGLLGVPVPSGSADSAQGAQSSDGSEEVTMLPQDTAQKLMGYGAGEMSPTSACA